MDNTYFINEEGHVFVLFILFSIFKLHLTYQLLNDHFGQEIKLYLHWMTC